MTSDRAGATLSRAGAGARRWCPHRRLADLRAEIEGRRSEVAPAVMAVVDRNLDFTPPAAVAAPRSLIVVAVPHACARVTVVVDGEEVTVPIPTTYCHHDEIQAEVAATLAASLAPAGLAAALMRLPEKLLAVCAGLARYGRNNIAYVDGWGSFVELVACVSDLGPGRRPLDRRARAAALRVLRGLPAGLPDRRHRRGPFSAARRALPDAPQRERASRSRSGSTRRGTTVSVGCLRCQRCCPEDLAVRDEVAETAAFDERETGLLVAGVDHGLLGREPRLREKLGDLGLLGYDDEFLGVALARNLRALLDAR